LNYHKGSKKYYIIKLNTIQTVSNKIKNILRIESQKKYNSLEEVHSSESILLYHLQNLC